MFYRELCDCGKDPLKRDEVRQLQLAYYQQLEELVNSGKYDGREDFAVVLQPHLRDMVDPPRNVRATFSLIVCRWCALVVWLRLKVVHHCFD
jgi:hypothetical protein